MRLELLIWVLGLLVQQASALIPGIYCGLDNCYDVLGLQRDAKQTDIVRTYRRLAKQHHPDLQRTKESKIAAQEAFLKIAAAYEVLRDNDSRKDYDYMLDNPDEMYRHYWHYYRRKVNVDVRPVIFVTISLISFVQYWAGWSKYNEAIDYFLTVPKYRFKAQEIAKEKGLLSNSKRKDRQKTREQLKREEDLVLRTIIEQQMDIRGAYQKPTYRDLLWVQLILLPYTLYLWIAFYVRWYVRFTLQKQEYGDEEKAYLARRNLGLSQGQWDQLEAEDRENYLALQLWIRDKYDAYKREKDAEAKAKLAESGQHKRYRRWMKKGGAGSITFLDD